MISPSRAPKRNEAKDFDFVLHFKHKGYVLFLIIIICMHTVKRYSVELILDQMPFGYIYVIGSMSFWLFGNSLRRPDSALNRTSQGAGPTAQTRIHSRARGGIHPM